MHRIKESYKGSAVQPFWTVGPNAFVVTLPKNVLPTPTEENEILANWLAENREFTARDLENYLNKSKATVRKIIEELLQGGRIVRVGSGPKTRYKTVVV